MADLVFRDKYSGKRLDHKDFSEVIGTSFASGVVTDFKKVSDDPLIVESMVKVLVNGDESDYIPLFYSPRLGYWDTTDHLSQDFNPAGYFENAWMSFRRDDEVKVMLRDGKPVAVLGFLDGIPRVGEDIVKVIANSIVWWQMSKQATYKDGDKSPDGFDLGLKLSADLITEMSGLQIPWYAHKTLSESSFASLAFTDVPFNVNSIFEIFSGTTRYYYANLTLTITTQQFSAIPRCQIHLLKIGPILFLIVAKWFQTISRIVSSTHSDVSGWHIACTFGAGKNYPGWIPFTEDGCPAVMASVEANIAGGNYTLDFGPPDDMSEHMTPQVNLDIYAALYSDKLYEEIKSNPPSYDFNKNTLIPDPPNGFTYQSGFFSNIDHLRVDITKGLSYYMRPHTKKELQDAGMWPEA